MATLVTYFAQVLKPTKAARQQKIMLRDFFPISDVTHSKVHGLISPEEEGGRRSKWKDSFQQLFHLW